MRRGAERDHQHRTPQTSSVFSLFLSCAMTCTSLESELPLLKRMLYIYPSSTVMNPATLGRCLFIDLLEILPSISVVPGTPRPRPRPLFTSILCPPFPNIYSLSYLRSYKRYTPRSVKTAHTEFNNILELYSISHLIRDFLWCLELVFSLKVLTVLPGISPPLSSANTFYAINGHVSKPCLMPMPRLRLRLRLRDKPQAMPDQCPVFLSFPLRFSNKFSRMYPGTHLHLLHGPTLHSTKCPRS